MPQTYWSPNQTAISQVETFTYSAPAGIGSTYTATINGKVVTYTSVSGDTAITVATAHYNLLNSNTGVPPELTEVTFTNPSDGVVVATASVPGTPFANITGGLSSGLVMSTGGGLVNGIATVHTTANTSPSDVNDSQNWLRFATPGSVGSRSLPINNDDVIVNNTSIPLLWNLDRLSAIQFNTYTRWQSFTGTIGLPYNNPIGYVEYRATYFKFSGPGGSVPAGGLQIVLGFDSGTGSGPGRENYDVGSTSATLTILNSGSALDDYTVRFLGTNTSNNFVISNSVSLAVGLQQGETSKLASCTVDNGGSVGIGANVIWTAGSTLTLNGGSANLNSAPNTIAISNSGQLTISTDSLTWPNITAQGGSSIGMLAGGIITNLTLTTNSNLDKSSDGRSLIITNSTIDGDSCTITDPLNSITFTNATSVKQKVSSGPIQFTGTRTIKVM